MARTTLTITATGKAAERNMLAVAKDAMQCLHMVNGIDWQSDHITIEASGKVTVNSVLAALSEGINDKNSVIIVMPCVISGIPYQNGIYHSVIRRGKFDIEHDSTINFFAVKNPYTVKDFENYRKICNKVFIVVQSKDQTVMTKEMNWDFAERMSVNSANNKSKNKHYVGFREMEQYMDKSGYCVYNVHSDYSQRVHKLKAERAQALANVYDCTADTEKIRTEIRRISNVMSELFKVPTVENIRKADNAMNRIKWLVNDFTLHERYIAERSYSSVDRIKRNIEGMEKDITLINAIIAE